MLGPTPPPRNNQVSIRQPGATPRGIVRAAEARTQPPARPFIAAAAARPIPRVRVGSLRSRPDPNPFRVMLGVAGLASAAALTTAMLPTVTPPAAAVQDAGAVDVTTQGAQPPVQHVTRYVTLQPGQTAPPQSTVLVAPTPSPRVTTRIVTRTRQSGG